MTDPRPWWHKDKHADRRPCLLARGQIKAVIRARLEAQDFVEVDTACLQVSPGNEAHLHAFRTEYRTEAGATRPYYLHTSPEFAMKKLLAAGEKRIFSFAPVFRNGERGPLHSPEFTMLEWYRAEAPYTRMMDDCADFLRLAADVTGRLTWNWRGVSACPAVPYVRTTMHEAFRCHAGIDLDRAINGTATDLDGMRRLAVEIGVRVTDDDTWSDLYSRILAERIEPKLGIGVPEMLDEYPTHEAALARPTAHDPRVAERFELYAAGIELANGFGELTDTAEQRRRFEAEMAHKQAVYDETYPIDEEFLAALAHMPAASGAAMGFDRLVMLATHAPHIDHVQWAPVVR